MGNCTSSVHKTRDSTSNLKCSSYSYAQCFLNKDQSPLQQNQGISQKQTAESSPAQLAKLGDQLGGKNDMFFDSHTNLESDSEDFFSVNGDNTPYYSNSIITQTPELDKSFNNKDGTLISIEKSSPSDVKKQLIELFHESYSGDPLYDLHQNSNEYKKEEAKSFAFEVPSNTTNVTPTNNRKESQSSQCCLPNFVRSLSLSDRKKTLSVA